MSIEITFVTICSWTILGDEMKNLQDVTEGYLCSYSFYRGGEHFSNRYCMCIVYLKDISKKVLDIVTIVYHWVGVGSSGEPFSLELISFHPYPMWMVHSESDGFPQTMMWEWIWWIHLYQQSQQFRRGHTLCWVWICTNRLHYSFSQC